MDIETRRAKVREYDSRPENKAKKKLYMVEYHKIHSIKNKEKIKERKRLYYLKNKEVIDNRNKKWILDNKDKWNEYRKGYYKENKQKIIDYGSNWERDMKKKSMAFKIRKGLRERLKDAFRKYSKFGKTMTSDEYGIDYDKIIEHLKPFPKDRSLYHIDHIIPLCAFDLTDPDQVRLAMSPDNFQWLLKEDNLHKISSDKKQSLRLKNKRLNKQQ